jgi:hypothetical protein
MSDGTVFGLQARHLGMNRIREIHLHAGVSATLDRIRHDVPGCIIDVLDGHGDRIPVRGSTGAFVAPVEIFDIPREAPRQLVVYGDDAAARVGEALPDLECLPAALPVDGIAFEVEQEHLGRDPFGLVFLNDDVTRAIDSVLGDTSPSRWKVLDEEGLLVKPPRQPSPVGGREGGRYRWLRARPGLHLERVRPALCRLP